MSRPVSASLARRAGLVMAAAAVAAAAVACSSDDDAAPDPGDGPATSTSSTSIVDLSNVVIEPVAGTTTTSILERGDAAIVGTVTGPNGPVPGATVRLERVVTDTVATHDAIADEAGRYEARGIPGGRYRIRAFLAPALAQVEPDVRFLRDDEEHTVDVQVEDRTGLVATADVAPEPPLEDRDVNLVVVLGTQSVDADGVVRATPAPGVTVELSGLSRWVLRPTPPTTRPSPPTFRATTTTTRLPARTATATTDADGRARFELRCTVPGPPGLALVVPVRRPATPPSGDDDPTTTSTAERGVTYERIELDLPTCVDPRTTTTTTEPGTDDDDGTDSDDAGGSP